jgi:hypothetical protein
VKDILIMNERAAIAKTRPFLVVGFCALALVAGLPLLAVVGFTLGGFVLVAPFVLVQYLLWGRCLGEDLARARAAEAARAWLEEMDRAALAMDMDNHAPSESLIAAVDIVALRGEISLPSSSESGLRRKPWTF